LSTYEIVKFTPNLKDFDYNLSVNISLEFFEESFNRAISLDQVKIREIGIYNESKLLRYQQVVLWF